jgi:Flp pilus assembly protein TadB
MRGRRFETNRPDPRQPERNSMTGSSEFSTWVALAGAAIFAGLCAIYVSSPVVLIAVALVGAFLGYKGEQVGRRYVEQYLSQRRSR